MYSPQPIARRAVGAEARSSRPDEVAAAYDAIAADYDRLVEEDRWMRHVLWAHYDAVFKPGDRVLEFGCGTGLDTLHLAARGLRMVAVDASPGMIERLRAKLDGDPHRQRIELRRGDVAEFAGWPEASFDGLVSAFAAVNTAGDLASFAAAAGRLLRPGGRMVLHLLAPAGLWERWQAASEAGLVAARNLRRRRERTVAIGGRPVRHRVATPAEARRLLSGAFRLRRAYGLGFLWPQAASRRIRPEVAYVLGRAEARLGSLWPLLGWGRFFVLDLERRR